MGQSESLHTELSRFRQQYPGIEQIYALLCDANGVLRGKRLTLPELDELYAKGRHTASSILWLDVTGKDIASYDLVWDDGDSDRVCRPIPGSLTPAPWLGERFGQVLMTMYDVDGTPAVADPRHVLASVLARYAELGLVPVVAAELEFYLVDLERDAEGKLQPPRSPRTGQRSWFKRGYEADDMEDFHDFLDEVHRTAHELGIPAQTVLAEYGPAQFEVTLRHQGDALRAMDQAVLFKRLIKGVAFKHGFQATFMAKPYTQESGSGLHMHMSMLDGAGNNIFASEDPEGAPALRHAIGGLQARLADTMLVFGPNGNSYRRLRVGFYAPVNTAWGVNNRTVSLRVPSGPAHARRVEHRVAGADANPYLAMAAVLAAAHDGLVHQRDPGAPISGDAGKLPSTNALPCHWLGALEHFAASSFVQAYFPAGFREIYIAIKRAEMAEFLGEVTRLDYDWYLRSV